MRNCVPIPRENATPSGGRRIERRITSMLPEAGAVSEVAMSISIELKWGGALSTAAPV